MKAALRRNSRWLNTKINNGYQIYDIGARGLTPTSPFYKKELKILDKRKITPIRLNGF